MWYNIIKRGVRMKKLLSSILVIIFLFLLLTACSNDMQESNSSLSDDNSTSTISTEEKQTTEVESLPLPQDSTEFSFLSGAGAWRTLITLNRDGTFTGYYLDSEMGEIGAGYPNGSAYTSTFSGKFDNIEKINEYSYKMTLIDVKTEKTVGEEWIEDEIRYIATQPYGLNDPINNQSSTEFILYLPNTPIDKVPEEFLTWWPYRYTQETAPKTTLSCYGILNVTTNYGFFAEQ